MANNYFNSDTIAAILTAPNAISAVGLIRVSGSDAWSCVTRLLRQHSSQRQKLQAESVESHKLYRCLVVGEGERLLDDGMFVWMKAPKSFTGEEVVELHLHGNPIILRRVMHELLIHGAREALPGEFSFRAFQNGKMTLDQAESVADLIASRSEESARRALGHLLGGPRKEVAALQREIVDRLAEIEIDIDFSDQGVSLLQHEQWAQHLERWCLRVEAMRSEYMKSQPLREGIRLAIVGEPNSGKSSLFNRLLGEERSIVSKEAGTTRDVVRETVQVHGLLFRLSDTAGIRSTGNSIEAQGIERSFGEVSSAHLVLWLFDGEKGEFPAEHLRSQWLGLQKYRNEETQWIAVWNKVDAVRVPGPSWMAFFEEEKIPTLALSARTGEGLDQLLGLISTLYASQEDAQPDFLLSRSRHFEVLGKAIAAVREAIAKVRIGQLYPDLLAADLRNALSHVGEITGEFSSDDLLNHIFAEFCIGK